jgi:hypothetical protein
MAVRVGKDREGSRHQPIGSCDRQEDLRKLGERLSLKRIAKLLNQEKVPPPQKRMSRESNTWCPNAIREMLRRDVYRGILIWNKRKFVKVPGTNKRVTPAAG